MASPFCVGYFFSRSQLITPEHRTQGLTPAKPPQTTLPLPACHAELPLPQDIRGKHS
jgi:hypothetical protein